MGFRSILAVALLAAAGTPSAAELGFAHFAPGAGEVLVEIDGESRALAYGGYEHVTQFEAGTRHLRATAVDGTVLAEGDLELLADDRYVVILAGNGTAAAPFEWRLATDHDRVFILEQWSLQTASLAITAAGGDVPAILVRDTCDASSQQRLMSEPYGDGSRALGSRAGGGGYRVTDGVGTCRVSATTPDGRVLHAAEYRPQRGERIRRFLAGDGVHAPYEIRVVSQGVDPVLPLMEPDASIEGLFAIEGEPNTGLQVAYNPAAPAGQRISAVYFGFESDGRASWRTIEDVRVLEYVGGNPEGTRAAVAFERARAFITPHSCRELSMLVTTQSGPGPRIFPAAPRNTLRLTRLFPPVCPPAVPNGQEEKP